MSLAAGSRLGVYEVTGPLGAGGMGEVYRARDTRLQRDVAIKILPDVFAADPDRLARFDREAQVLAALNHPHIAAIYGVEEGRALVLELVEGETLAERIARGPIAPAEALPVARQIIDALDAAHQQGIIHRDLKPANIKITPAGVAKVLDFGLAKLNDPNASHGSNASNALLSLSPTLTSPAMQTGVGLLLGTAAYMAPEQARGRSVDKRADIWAFGCVLFEMLTGHRPFEGSDVSEVLAGVIKGEPAWETLPASTPPSMRAVLRRCLEKDPALRLRDCGDVRLALDGAFDTTAPAVVARPTRLWLMTAAAVVAAAAIGAGVVWFTRPEPPAGRPVRFQVAAPPATTLGFPFVVSPDGQHAAFIAFNAEGVAQLWVHAFDTGQSRVLERAGQVNSPPFWSPDSRTIGFASLGALRKMDLSGSPPETVLSGVTNYSGGAWAPSGLIVVAQSDGIYAVPAAGGTARKVTTVDTAKSETRHAHPSWLADGRRFVYLRSSTVPGASGIYVADVDAAPEAQSAQRIVAAEQGARVATAPDSGESYLLFLRNSALMVQRLDAGSAALQGEPVRVADGVGSNPAIYGHFSVAAGALTYRPSSGQSGGVPTWVDRSGRFGGPAAAGVPRNAQYPRISPDGTRLAVVVDGNMWLHHLDGRPPIKLTFDGDAYTPLWTVDGQRVIYEGSPSLKSVAADGSVATPQRLSPNGHYHPHGVSSDGTRIVAVLVGSNGPDIVSVSGADTPHVPVVQTPANEGFAGTALSPNGRWLAYTSNVTGTVEIWVRPYPGPGAAVRVSPDSGTEPVWSRDGRELYYLSGRRMMAAAVSGGPALAIGAPRALFEARFATESQPPSYDVAADGRFVMLSRDNDAPPPPVTVILNWMSALPAN